MKYTVLSFLSLICSTLSHTTAALSFTAMTLGVVPYGVDLDTWLEPIPSTAVSVRVNLVDTQGHLHGHATNFGSEDSASQFEVDFKLVHLGNVLWEGREQLTRWPTYINLGTSQSFESNTTQSFVLAATLVPLATQDPRPPVTATTSFYLGDATNSSTYLRGPCADVFPVLERLKHFGHRPPVNIPSEMCMDFSLNSSIPIYRKYADDTDLSQSYISRDRAYIDELIRVARYRVAWYYGDTDQYLYTALSAHSIAGKSVLIIGSNMPWYEAIALSFGAREVITLEYNTLDWDHPNLTTVTVEEWDRPGSVWSSYQADVVISLSALEHDGLGRYGDDINPFADFQAMEKIRTRYLKRDAAAFLILSVPVGQDAVIFNAFRIYGKIRLPMLGRGFEMLNFYHQDVDIMHHHFKDAKAEPVMVLKPRWSEVGGEGEGELMVLPMELITGRNVEVEVEVNS